MSSGPAQSSSSRRAVNRRRGPGWRQWVLALGGAAVFVVALVAFVNRENSAENGPATASTSGALAEQNREARLLVGRDQAPHVLALRQGAPPALALKAAVVGYMKRQIAQGTIDGPVTSSSCTRAGGGSGAGGSPGRLAFRCAVVAANVTYPFLGAVDTGSHRATYCKRDAAPVPSLNIPVSPRCT